MKGALASRSFCTDPPLKKKHPRLATWCEAFGDRLKSSCSRKIKGNPCELGHRPEHLRN